MVKGLDLFLLLTMNCRGIKVLAILLVRMLECLNEGSELR